MVITTNHKTDGLYLPADDRRHYVAWSDRTKDDFASRYWPDLYAWFVHEGNRHVAAYLTDYDLSNFDPKAPPPKTAAFWDVVDANRSPEDAELADVLDTLGQPNVTTLALMAQRAGSRFAEWLCDRKNARQIPHRLEAAGYVPVGNPDAQDGLWRIEGRRQVIYVRRNLSTRDHLALNTLLKKAVEWEVIERMPCAVHLLPVPKVTVPKGGRLRYVPLTTRLGVALRDHRHLRGPRVVCEDDGTPLTSQKVQYRMKRAARRANLKRDGVHVLRHTFCSHLAMRGAPARAIQELVGHQDLSMTQRYST